MSIIFGYINLTNKPVERATLETMKKAMDFWGPDGEGLWIEDTCGIGNLLYYNTPEALFEKLPISDLSGNLVMTAGARIDNREELFRIFDIPLGQRLTMPDSALMLKAFEKWGEACADHMVGDWAFAIWDRRERKLFLARDHHGITALYYYKGEDFFAFSSSLKGILCLPQVPKKVNEYKIAQLLVNWNEGGPTTCYLDIMRLPPAHTLILYAHPHHTHTSSTLTLNRYWYLEHTPEIHLANDQEYADMFLDLYTEAVRCRLRSHRPVGATLSSGLDSGSVCILAAKELAKQGKRLQAYTAVPLYDVPAPPNRIGNEGPLAMALAEKLGNVDVTLCRAEGIGVLEGIQEKIRIHDQPFFSPRNAFWIVDILSTSKTNEMGSLLIGQSGNLTISWPPKNQIKSNFYLKTKIGMIFIKRFLRFLLGYWQKDFIINEELIKKYSIKYLMTQNRVLPYFESFLSSKDIRLQILGSGKTSLGDIWAESALFNKIEIRDPTIDIRLMAFLFSIPANSTCFKTRKIFEEIFQSFFPIEILKNKIRGLQASDLLQRLSINDLNEIEEYISRNRNSYLFSQKRIKELLNINISESITQLLLFYQINYFKTRIGQINV